MGLSIFNRLIVGIPLNTLITKELDNKETTPEYDQVTGKPLKDKYNEVWTRYAETIKGETKILACETNPDRYANDEPRYEDVYYARIFGTDYDDGLPGEVEIFRVNPEHDYPPSIYVGILLAAGKEGPVRATYDDLQKRKKELHEFLEKEMGYTGESFIVSIPFYSY